MSARDDTNNKCRLDQAQRIHHSAAMVDPALRALIHPTTVHTQIRHSREGGKTRPKADVSRNGHPGSFANNTGSPPSRGRGAGPGWPRARAIGPRIEARRKIETCFLADAKWIPAYAGMTGWGAGPGWPTGWLSEARFSGRAS